MLRGSGLWVPMGTPLLLSPDKHEKVLCIAPLDDSDGHLSLSVRWSSDWAMRDHNSLPPYWVLIKGMPPTRPVAKADVIDQPEEQVDEVQEAEEKKSSTSKYIPFTEDAPPAIRCQIGINGLMNAIPDDFDAQMFDNLNIRHLETIESISTSPGVWFASAITAFGTSSQTILWNYKIPTDILSFAKKRYHPLWHPRPS